MSLGPPRRGPLGAVRSDDGGGVVVGELAAALPWLGLAMRGPGRRDPPVQEGVPVAAKLTSNSRARVPQVGEIFQGQYFGERALLRKEPRAANVIAAESADKVQLRVLYISKAAFEEVLGSLQEIIDSEANWRYKVCAHQRLAPQRWWGAMCFLRSTSPGSTCAT